MSALSIINSRDNPLWLQCWRDKHTDFHQLQVNSLLTRFWSSLNLAVGSRVFVPLCGKSLDMLWLAGQGHRVIGVELSPVAVRAFFHENQLKATCRKQGKFTLWQHGRISILCGDYFALSKTDLGQFDTVYDRAALTALPEDMRLLYVQHLKTLVDISAQVFLLTTEDSADTGVDTEINLLYAANYQIELAHVESFIDSDSLECSDYKLYRLTQRG